MASSEGHGAGLPESDATQYNVDVDKLLQPLDSEIDIKKTPATLAERQSFMVGLANVKIPEYAKYCYMKQYKEKEKEGCYPMTHKQRGRALLVTMTRDREGWKGDVEALYKMFLYLDVRVDYQFDLPGKGLVNELEQFASSKENKNVDCLFVVLMGHGGQMKDKGDNKNKEYLLTADNFAFFVQEGLAAIFSNARHPQLVDKPKIFLVQMCRGGSTSEEVIPDTTASDVIRFNKPSGEKVSPVPSSGDDKPKPKTSGTVSRPPEARKSDKPPRKTAAFTDYLFGFATQPGLKAFRENVEGAWYIQELSRVFLEKAADRQVTNMLEEVNSLLEKVSVGRRGSQVAESTSGLKKALYLFPGLQKTDKPPAQLNPAPRVLELSAASNPEIQSAFRVVGLEDQGALISFGFNSPFYVMRVGKDGKRIEGKSDFSTDNEVNALILCKIKEEVKEKGNGGQESLKLPIQASEEENGRDGAGRDSPKQSSESEETPSAYELIVAESTGCIKRCSLDKLECVTESWTTKIDSLWHATALSRSELLIVDSVHGQILTYNLDSKTTEKRIGGLDFPTNVACDHTGDSTVFAVTDQGRHHVLVYDLNWKLKFTVGGKGEEDGKLKSPTYSIFLPPMGSKKVGNLLVSDRDNHRLSEFTREGGFIRHWLTKAENGLTSLGSISFVFPYVWVVHSPGQRNVSKYQIFDEEY